MLQAGQRIGSYRVIGPLGEGAMGAVFEAVHESIERRVAIKVLHPDLSGRPELAARFINEARAVNIIDHPGLVTVSDYGHLESGAPFIVMELLRGESLKERIRRGELGDQALQIAQQLSRALAAAHEKGIIHRDLKPTNVMLVPDASAAGGVRVKILDFGIAKVAAAGRGEGGSLETATGVVLGTPAYIAPEQCRGASQVTDRADVYSLGVMLYEMLGGQRPFYGAEAEILGKHLYQEPPPLSSLRPALAPELLQLVHAMLRKEPEARPGLAEVIRVLEEVEGLASTVPGLRRPVVVPPSAASPSPFGTDSRPGLASGPGGRSPRGGGAGGDPGGRASPRDAEGSGAGTDSSPRSTLNAAAGATGSLGATWRGPARRRGALALGGAAALLLGLGGLALRGGRPGHRASVPAPVTAPAPAPAAPLPEEPRLGLAALRDFHDASGAARNALSSREVWEAAAGSFARVADLPGAPRRWRAGRAFCEGRAALLREEVQPAIERLRQAVQLDEEWASAHAALASALDRAEDREGAIAAVRRAQELEPAWWVPLAIRARFYLRDGNATEAIRAYRRALLLSPEEPSLLDQLALALHAAGLDTEAEELADRALAKDPHMVWSRVVRAEEALERGDGKAALAQAEGALGQSPRNSAASLARADALALLGRREEAREAYEAFLALVKTRTGMGLSEERLALVRKALADGRLPPPRRGRGGKGSRDRKGKEPAQRTRGDQPPEGNKAAL